jgi:Leucine-rich repeat (LRR) protein
LPDSILKLDRLESIAIEGTPLKKMPLDLRELKALKKLRLEHTGITESEISKFKLPEGCEIQIID